LNACEKAEGVTGAGFALAVGFCPITDRSKTLGCSPFCPRNAPTAPINPFIHMETLLFVWERVIV